MMLNGLETYRDKRRITDLTPSACYKPCAGCVALLEQRHSSKEDKP